MHRGVAVVVASAAIAAAGFVIRADTRNASHASDVQLQLAGLLFEDGRYADSLEAYRKALDSDDPSQVRQARAGVVQSALRIAEFNIARREAETLLAADPHGAEARSLYGDAVWASGLFDEAETAYQGALAAAPDHPRGLHGMARSLLARGQLAQAMDRAQAALKLAPRDLEIHHTVGAIFERMH